MLSYPFHCPSEACFGVFRDALDDVEILDIKPYVPPFDAYPQERYGWFEGKLGAIESARSDDRFTGDCRNAQ